MKLVYLPLIGPSCRQRRCIRSTVGLSVFCRKHTAEILTTTTEILSEQADPPTTRKSR